MYLYIVMVIKNYDISNIVQGKRVGNDEEVRDVDIDTSYNC